MIFIAVGTPPPPDGGTDLRAVEEVAREIGRTLNGYKVVVTKSTVPVGTASACAAGSRRSSRAPARTVDFGVASNPEFLREGAAIGDFMRPDRVVIGADDSQATAILQEPLSPALPDRDPGADHQRGPPS